MSPPNLPPNSLFGDSEESEDEDLEDDDEEEEEPENFGMNLWFSD